MSDQLAIQSTDDPCEEVTSGDFKILGKIRELLTTRTPRDATIHHDPATVEKATHALITSIMLESGFDTSQEFNNAVIDLILTVLETIAEAPDVNVALEAAIKVFKTQGRERSLSLHRTTVDAMIPHMTKADMERVVEQDYVEDVESAATERARSRAIILTIDDTYEPSRPEHLNGNYSYIVSAQQKQWRRGLKFSSVYDSTHQRFLGSVHRDNYLPPDQRGTLRPWIQDLQAKVAVVRQAGSRVAVIEGDRDYFDPLFFACAFQGMFDPGAPAREQPRAVTPWFFHRNKKPFKWTFLLDPTRPQVLAGALTLDPRKHAGSHAFREGTLRKTPDGSYLIPCVRVALVDEYAKDSPRSLDQLRTKAIEVQSRITAIDAELRVARAAYFTYQKRCKTKHAGLPGKARPRKVFADATDRRLYQEAARLHKARQAWEKKKNTLIGALSFFAVSSRPGEAPESHPSRFIALARDYHERWGHENGFRDVKHFFLRPSRSRKPTRRQFYWVLGMLLYNDWHRVRVREILTVLRKRAWNIVPWDPRRVWVRRKHEQDLDGIVTAKAYMIRLWKEGAMGLLKKALKRMH